jgi:single-strand DNA-binding protein
MADINTVVLVGRLTRDAQLKYSNSGLAITELSIAVNSRTKQGDQWVDEANFFDVTVFGRQGEAIQRYLVKGKQVGVEGRLKQDRWQNQEGQNRSKVAIVANNVMLLGDSRGERSGDGGGRPAPNGGGTGGSPGDGGFGGDDFPDGIPF